MVSGGTGSGHSIEKGREISRNAAGRPGTVLWGTWWFIPLSKWVITLVVNGTSGVKPPSTAVLYCFSSKSFKVSTVGRTNWGVADILVV